jgi:adenylate cyclase
MAGLYPWYPCAHRIRSAEEHDESETLNQLQPRLPDPADLDTEAAVTVLFVDLVRFTSLTEVHGDVTAADASAALERLARGVASRGARMVKSVGDGVLITAESPAAGLLCASAIVEGLHELEMGLDARGGLDHGAVVNRNADVFGSTVNLAARLADVPGPGHLAMTRVVAAAAGAVDLAVAPLGSLDLKGFRSAVEVFEVDPCLHGGNWLTDPVCGMRVRADDAVQVRDAASGTVGFCSERCSDLFRTDRP